MIDEATIAETGRRIGAAAPAGSRVILFGSHARGDANAHSDIDILVIEPEVDVLVVDEDKARRRAKVKGTVIERALREGRDLVPWSRRLSDRCGGPGDPQCFTA
ncbi:MAG TPA: nucleotidyltransferase domain-containing protein [Solirubrobacterales bacterium]|jgi:predicted nucleotidyltransferase